MTTYPKTVSVLSPELPSLLSLSIVIVCLNNRRYLEPCLKSVFAAGLQRAFEVIVVDNGSTDGSHEMVAAGFPEVVLIRNDKNRGLSQATNQGLCAARGEYLLLLNDDTLVNGASLNAMVGFLDANPHVGAAGGKLLNGDGSLQAGYTPFSSVLDEFVIATGLDRFLWPGYPSRADANEPKPVDWIGSACLLLRRRALIDVGLLDEDFFIYGDEADLQYRLHKNGWSVYYLPNVHTIHFGGRSMDRWRRRKMVYRGKLLFYRKNYDLVRTSALRLLLAALSALKLAVWAAAFALPKFRKRAKLELNSNLDVIKVCARMC